MRALPERLSELEHAHHDLVVSSTAMRLDHQDSLVSVMLKGRTEALRKLVDHIVTQRGVRLAQLNLIAVQPGDDHEHPGDHEHHGHEHLSPVTS